MSTQNKKGILLMAYGSPERVEEVGDYFTHIRGGVRPGEEFIQKISERYIAVGGKTPLLEITKAQAAALQEKLGDQYKIFIGMKHWHPYIKDVLPEIKKEGITEVTALTLAPHYSKMSIGGYKKFIDEAKGDLNVKIIESWNKNPKLIKCVTLQMKEVIEKNNLGPDIHIIFTAHSLPERIRGWNDPYESQIKETAELVARNFPKNPWSVAYQSMGQTGEPWIGPHLLEELVRLTESGVKSILITPIGFVSDNLEINYDIDIEAKKKADELGVNICRPEMRNAHPVFIEALAEAILEKL